MALLSTQKSAVKQYALKLPDLLKKSYGGSGTHGYTEGQVSTAVDKLGLNKKYIEYAFLMFCGEKMLLENGYDSEHILAMIKYLNSVGSGGSLIGDGVAGIFGGMEGSLDGGSGGDGGGGGDGG